MITMPSLMAIVGEDANSDAVQALLASDSPMEVQPSASDSTHSVLSNHRDGFQLDCRNGKIETVHLYLIEAYGFQPFRGTLVSELTAASTRTDTRHRLGRPSFTGEARDVPNLGRVGPWDRFDSSALAIHFEYIESDESIRRITIMSAESAPVPHTDRLHLHEYFVNYYDTVDMQTWLVTLLAESDSAVFQIAEEYRLKSAISPDETEIYSIENKATAELLYLSSRAGGSGVAS